MDLKAIMRDGHQNNIIDKMQTRKRLYELIEYEKYNTILIKKLQTLKLMDMNNYERRY